MSADAFGDDAVGELISRHLDGDLDEQELRSFDQLLRSDATVAQRLASAGRLHAAMRAVALVRLEHRRGASTWWRPAALIAAALAVATGIWLWSASGTALATVASGRISVERGGDALTLASGATLRSGDGVRTRPDESARLRFPDGSAIDLAADTRLRLDDEPGGKLLRLDGGRIDAKVATQPAGRPLRVMTATAMAEVLGTRLQVAVDGQGTRLEVSEGRVSFTDRRSGGVVEVEAGASSRISPDVPGLDWSGELALRDPAGKPLTVQAHIPDLGKPIRVALVMSCAYDDPDWQAVAARFNALMIATSLNSYDTATDATKILAILRRASARFPAHPEIQHTGVVLLGWSQAASGALRTASRPELANRVAAVVAVHEIAEAPWQAPLSVPHLFISAWPDWFSSLLDGRNAMALARARRGAPITVVNDAGRDHDDIAGGSAFTRIWLEEVLKRRLPAEPSSGTDVVLPDWTKDPDGWLGAYDVVEGTGVQPWGFGQRLTNLAIAAHRDYADSRQPIWLPSQRCAQAWQAYGLTGRMPSGDTLAHPTTDH